MAKKISELTAAAALVGDEQLPVTQGGSTKRASLGAITPPGYIDGLKMVWVSGTALTVTSGSAYIPSLGRVLRAEADIAKAGLTLSASTWYHVYLFLNGSTPDIEIVTTAPAAPYNGTARAKTGDTSRRYIGSVLADASGHLGAFQQSGETVKWLMPIPRVLANGTATAETTVSASAAMPATARIASVRLINTATAGRLRTGTSDDTVAFPDSLITVEVATGPSRDAYVDHPVNASQALTYWFDAAPTGGGAYIDVYGYIYER